MKIVNTTEWPDYFLRRMVSWCCKLIELSAREVKRASFGNKSRGAVSGHAYETMRFHISVGPGSSFPVKSYLYPGLKSEAYRSPAYEDRLEGLVAVTAHELTHLRDYLQLRAKPMIRSLRRGPGERNTMRNERAVLDAFRANRDPLVAEWLEPPAEKPAKPPIQERRAAKTQSALDRWQRKLKLAQTKVRKLRHRVRYYERALAAKR